MVLNRDSILKAKRKVKPVELPELDGTICVREISESEAFEFLKRQQSGDQNGAVLYLLARCVVNEDGTRVFADEDQEAIGELGASVANALLTPILELSGMVDTKKNA